MSKKKVVSADNLQDTLTTFSELYEEATPEERQELMRLHINQLFWSPEESSLLYLKNPGQR